MSHWSYNKAAEGIIIVAPPEKAELHQFHKENTIQQRPTSLSNVVKLCWCCWTGLWKLEKVAVGDLESVQCRQCLV